MTTRQLQKLEGKSCQICRCYTIVVYICTKNYNHNSESQQSLNGSSLTAGPILSVILRKNRRRGEDTSPPLCIQCNVTSLIAHTTLLGLLLSKWVTTSVSHSVCYHLYMVSKSHVQKEKKGEKRKEKKKKGDTNLASVLLVKRVGYDYSEKGEGKHAIQQRSLFGISNIFSSLKQNQCSLCVPA